MLEKTIETAACKWARAAGWIVYKFVSPGNVGVPDRIFLRRGAVVFIEFKATGKKPTKRQLYELERLRAAGFASAWFDNVEDVIDYLTWCDQALTKP